MTSADLSAVSAEMLAAEALAGVLAELAAVSGSGSLDELAGLPRSRHRGVVVDSLPLMRNSA